MLPEIFLPAKGVYTCGGVCVSAANACTKARICALDRMLRLRRTQLCLSASERAQKVRRAFSSAASAMASPKGSSCVESLCIIVHLSKKHAAAKARLCAMAGWKKAEAVCALGIYVLYFYNVETVCCLYHQKDKSISLPYEPKDAD